MNNYSMFVYFMEEQNTVKKTRWVTYLKLFIRHLYNYQILHETLGLVSRRMKKSEKKDRLAHANKFDLVCIEQFLWGVV